VVPTRRPQGRGTTGPAPGAWRRTEYARLHPALAGSLCRTHPLIGCAGELLSLVVDAALKT